MASQGPPNPMLRDDLSDHSSAGLVLAQKGEDNLVIKPPSSPRARSIKPC